MGGIRSFCLCQKQKWGERDKQVRYILGLHKVCVFPHHNGVTINLCVVRRDDLPVQRVDLLGDVSLRRGRIDGAVVLFEFFVNYHFVSSLSCS